MSALVRERGDQAGVNAKALSVYMGHSSIKITYDRYGHLLDGDETQAAERLDAFLERFGGRRLPVRAGLRASQPLDCRSLSVVIGNADDDASSSECPANPRSYAETACPSGGGGI